MRLHILATLISLYQAIYQNGCSLYPLSNSVINLNSDYTFIIKRAISQPTLSASSSIALSFPSTSFTPQSQLTCQYRDQASSKFVSTTCTLDTSGLTVTFTSIIGQQTDQSTYVILVSNVKNPGQTGLFDSPSINIQNSNTILESCTVAVASSITITPGALSCSGTSLAGVVGLTSNLQFSASITNTVPQNGYFIVSLTQTWTNDLANTVIAGNGVITCSAIGFTGNNPSNFGQLTCSNTAQQSLSYVSSVLSSSVQTKLQITFGMINVPSSASNSGSFSIGTFDSKGHALDFCSSIQISNWLPNTMTFNSLQIGIAGTVNGAASGNVCFTTTTPLYPSDSIDVTFPIQIPLNQVTSVQDTNYVLSYTQTYYPTLTGQIITFTAQTNLKASTKICLQFNILQAPPSTQTTDSMIFRTRRQNNNIDLLTSGATFTATAGQLISVTIVPSITTIYAQATYNIKFTLANQLQSDGYLTIQVPQSLVISSPKCGIMVGSSTTQITQIQCTNNNNLFTLQGITNNALPAFTQLTVVLSTVQNLGKSTHSDSFTITTFYSLKNSPYSVDTSSSGFVTSFTNDFLDITQISISTSNLVTGQPSTFTFIFQNKNPIPAGGSVLITLPIQVVSTQLQGDCYFQNNQTFCTILSSNPTIISISIPSAVASASLINLKIINQLLNPCSTQQSDSFQIATTTADNFIIDKASAGITVTMTTPSMFESFLLVDRSSKVNGANSIYTFQIIFGITQDAQSFIKLGFPNNVVPNIAPICTSNGATLYCFLQDASTIVVKLQPAAVNANIPAHIPFNVTISSFINPPSLFMSASITGSTYKQTASNTYQISYSLQGISVQNLFAKLQLIIYIFSTINNGIVQESTPYLDEISDYQVSFGLTNPIQDNAYLNIQIPNKVQIGGNITCSKMVGLPLGTQCQVNGRMITLISSSASNIFSKSISLDISGLINPSVVQSDQFHVYTYQDNYLVDEGTIGYFQALCQLPCRTCTTAKNCTSCYTDPILTQNQIYYNSNKGTCEAYCPIGYFQPDLNVKQCVQCSPNCATCAVTYDNCLSCPSNSFLINILQKGNCVTQCPLGFFNNPLSNTCDNCPTTCNSCTTFTNCTSCNGQKFLINNNCSNQCPSGITVGNLQSKFLIQFKAYTCDSCTNNCQTCAGFPSNCLTCQPPYLLSNNSCLIKCGNGTYQSGQQCLNCAYPCSNCISTNENGCLSCSSNRFIYDSQCLNQCPANLFRDKDQCIGCKSPCLTCANSPDICTSCDQNTNTPYLLNQACRSTCPDTYYPDLGEGKCLQCIAPCLKCERKDVCLSCLNSAFILFGGSCVASCPQHYYDSGSICSTCEDGCLNCNASVCNQCISSYLSIGNKCVQKCPSGFQVSSDGPFCIQNPLIPQTAEQNIVQDNLQRQKFIPVPFCCACFVFLLSVIVAKFQVPETFMPGAIVGFCGLMEWGSWITLLFLTYKDLGIHRSLLPQLFGIGFNFILNITNLIFYKRNIYEDPEYMKWLQVSSINRFSNIILTTLSLIFSFKGFKFLLSKYFGFKFFKAKLTSVSQLLPFNIISLSSIFFCSMPLIIGGVLVMYDDNNIDQLFVSALDCVIVTALMIVAILWEGQKNEKFFQDDDGHYLNFSKMIQRALHPNGSEQFDDTRIVVNSPSTKKRASQINQSILDRSDLKLIQQISLETEQMNKNNDNNIMNSSDQQTFKARGFTRPIQQDESEQNIINVNEPSQVEAANDEEDQQQEIIVSAGTRSDQSQKVKQNLNNKKIIKEFEKDQNDIKNSNEQQVPVENRNNPHKIQEQNMNSSDANIKNMKSSQQKDNAQSNNKISPVSKSSDLQQYSKDKNANSQIGNQQNGSNLNNKQMNPENNSYQKPEQNTNCIKINNEPNIEKQHDNFDKNIFISPKPESSNKDHINKNSNQNIANEQDDETEMQGNKQQNPVENKNNPDKIQRQNMDSSNSNVKNMNSQQQKDNAQSNNRISPIDVQQYSKDLSNNNINLKIGNQQSDSNLIDKQTNPGHNSYQQPEQNTNCVNINNEPNIEKQDNFDKNNSISPQPEQSNKDQNNKNSNQKIGNNQDDKTKMKGNKQQNPVENKNNLDKIQGQNMDSSNSNVKNMNSQQQKDNAQSNNRISPISKSSDVQQYSKDLSNNNINLKICNQQSDSNLIDKQTNPGHNSYQQPEYNTNCVNINNEPNIEKQDNFDKNNSISPQPEQSNKDQNNKNVSPNLNASQQVHLQSQDKSVSPKIGDISSNSNNQQLQNGKLTSHSLISEDQQKVNQLQQAHHKSSDSQQIKPNFTNKNSNLNNDETLGSKEFNITQTDGQNLIKADKQNSNQQPDHGLNQNNMNTNANTNNQNSNQQLSSGNRIISKKDEIGGSIFTPQQQQNSQINGLQASDKQNLNQKKILNIQSKDSKSQQPDPKSNDPKKQNLNSSNQHINQNYSGKDVNRKEIQNNGINTNNQNSNLSISKLNPISEKTQQGISSKGLNQNANQMMVKQHGNDINNSQQDQIKVIKQEKFQQQMDQDQSEENQVIEFVSEPEQGLQTDFKKQSQFNESKHKDTDQDQQVGSIQNVKQNYNQEQQSNQNKINQQQNSNQQFKGNSSFIPSSVNTLLNQQKQNSDSRQIDSIGQIIKSNPSSKLNQKPPVSQTLDNNDNKIKINDGGTNINHTNNNSIRKDPIQSNETKNKDNNEGIDDRSIYDDPEYEGEQLNDQYQDRQVAQNNQFNINKNTNESQSILGYQDFQKGIPLNNYESIEAYNGLETNRGQGDINRPKASVGVSRSRLINPSNIIAPKNEQLGAKSTNNQFAKKNKGDMETPKKNSKSNTTKSQNIQKSFQSLKNNNKSQQKRHNNSNVDQILPYGDNMDQIQNIQIQNFDNTRSISPISKLDQSDINDNNPINFKQFYGSKLDAKTIQPLDEAEIMSNEESLRSLSDAQMDYNEVSPSDFNAMNQRYEEEVYDANRIYLNKNKQNTKSQQNRSPINNQYQVQKQNYADNKTQRSQNFKLPQTQPQQATTLRKLTTINNEDQNLSQERLKRNNLLINFKNNEMLEGISQEGIDKLFNDQNNNNLQSRKNISVEKKEFDRQRLKGLEAIYLQRIDNNLGKTQIKPKKKKGGKNTPPKQGIDNFFIDDDVDELAF